MYEEMAGSGDDGEKVQLLRKLDSSLKRNARYDCSSSNGGYDEEMGKKFKVVGGRSGDNADSVTSPEE